MGFGTFRHVEMEYAMRSKIENEHEVHVWATVYAACAGEMTAEAAARKADEAVKRFRSRWDLAHRKEDSG